MVLHSFQKLENDATTKPMSRDAAEIVSPWTSPSAGDGSGASWPVLGNTVGAAADDGDRPTQQIHNFNILKAKCHENAKLQTLLPTKSLPLK